MNCRKPAILLVDDDVVCLTAIQMYLAHENYTVITTESGEKAWEILSSGQYNFSAVITDRMMPGMDGVELTRKINAHPVFKNIPILMITSEAKTCHKVDAVEGGVFDFLIKPVEKKLLLLVLKRAVEKGFL
ncbi:MAG: response regulator [Gammaproteobacteria bacterium]